MPIPRLTDTQYAAFRVIYRNAIRASLGYALSPSEQSNARAINKRTLEALARVDLIEHTSVGWRPTNTAIDLVMQGSIECGD